MKYFMALIVLLSTQLYIWLSSICWIRWYRISRKYGWKNIWRNQWKITLAKLNLAVQGSHCIINTIEFVIGWRFLQKIANRQIFCLYEDTSTIIIRIFCTWWSFGITNTTQHCNNNSQKIIL